MLMVKHKTSAKGVEDARNNFQELSESLQEEYMKDWAKQESEAQKIGGNALKIYEVTSVKGIQFEMCFPILLTQYFAT